MIVAETFVREGLGHGIGFLVLGSMQVLAETEFIEIPAMASASRTADNDTRKSTWIFMLPPLTMQQ